MPKEAKDGLVDDVSYTADGSESLLPGDLDLSDKSPVAEARRAYISAAGSMAAAVDFETACLSIGHEFLPECALLVLSDCDAATPEYFGWLTEQMCCE